MENIPITELSNKPYCPSEYFTHLAFKKLNKYIVLVL